MARRFNLVASLEEARQRIEEVAAVVVDRFDPDALVFVRLSSFGRIHLIVVSDRIRGATSEEKQLWDEVEAQLDPDDADLVSLWQLLGTSEALRMHGPLDRQRLLETSVDIRESWRRLAPNVRSALQPIDAENVRHQVRGEISMVEAWADAGRLICDDVAVRDLVQVSREARELLFDHFDQELPEEFFEDVERIPALLDGAVQALNGRAVALAA